jgi:hypothetical protein
MRRTLFLKVVKDKLGKKLIRDNICQKVIKRDFAKTRLL